VGTRWRLCLKTRDCNEKEDGRSVSTEASEHSDSIRLTGGGNPRYLGYTGLPPYSLHGELVRLSACCRIVIGVACSAPATGAAKANIHWPIEPPVLVTAYTIFPGGQGVTSIEVRDSGAHSCGSTLEGSLVQRGRVITISLSARPIVYDSAAPHEERCPASLGIGLTKDLHIAQGVYDLCVQTSAGAQHFHLLVSKDKVQPVLVAMPNETAPPDRQQRSK
jgi:hypothetical protein